MRQHDKEVTEFVAWLRKNKLECLVKHVNKPVELVIRPRRQKRSRLTGEAK